MTKLDTSFRQPKPPLGVVPKGIHDLTRVMQVLGAIKRFSEAGQPPKLEWIDEVIDYVGSH